MPCNFKNRKSKLIEYDNPYIYSKCRSFKTFSFKLLLSSLYPFNVSESKKSFKLFLFSFSIICIDSPGRI